MNKLLTLLFIVSSSAAITAQKNNYLVTMKSDTVYGEIRILSYDQLDRVQVSGTGKKEVFSALQILVLNLNGENYRPIQIEKNIRLMKQIKSGFLSLYGFRLQNQSLYEGRYLVKQDGTSMELPNIGFKKILSLYLESCTQVSDQIKNGMYTRGQIEEIVDAYNQCVLNNNPKITQPVTTSTLSNESQKQRDALQELSTLIKAQEFSSQKDAVEMLKDIQSKVERNEPVPNYLMEGLRSMLKDQPTLLQAFEGLASLLKK
jgi:hypothetical protein